MNIENAKKINGWMYESELETLAKWASEHDNIIELGSWKGRSTRAICDNMRGVLTAIDHWKGPKDIENYTWDYQEVINYGSDYVFKIWKENIKEYLENERLDYVRKSGKLAAKYLRKSAGDGSFDMIFIDASHDYESAKEDILNYLPLLAEEGMICGHDYNWEGVKQAVDELLPGFGLEGNMWYKVI